jgi:hypothetical protein
MRSLIRLLVCVILAFASPVRAQDEVAAFYLGREDVTADGQINTLDPVGVYVAYASGENVRLSASDTQVFSYAANPARDSIAYISADDLGVTLHIAALDGSTTSYGLTNTRFALVERYGAQVWLSGQDDAGENFLIGIDPATGGETRARLEDEDIVLSFGEGERGALAYSAAQGRITLVALPALAVTPFALSARILSSPAWSPAGDSFALVADDVGGTGLSLIIMTTGGEMRTLPLPAIADPQIAFVDWSAAGSFITIKIEDSTGTPGVTQPLLLVDVANDAVTTLGDGSAYIESIAWASDDRALLLSANRPGEDATLEYRLYDVATALQRPLETLSLAQPTFFAWRANTSQLWVLGTPFVEGQSSISAFDTATDTLSFLYTVPNNSLLGGALLWSTAGDRLIVVESVQDPISQLMGVAYSLSRFDEASAALVRLSPSTVSPLPFGVQVP